MEVPLENVEVSFFSVVMDSLYGKKSSRTRKDENCDDMVSESNG
jgi:hypothetical protein